MKSFKEFISEKLGKKNKFKFKPDRNGDIDCYNSQLTSLEGAPEKVKGNFNCEGNDKLVSLKGAPKEIGKDFICTDNDELTSLEGAPEKVGRDFICTNNPKLISFKDAPKEIGGTFCCYYNKNLVSLEGVPKELKCKFEFKGNRKLSKREVNKFSKEHPNIKISYENKPWKEDEEFLKYPVVDYDWLFNNKNTFIKGS